MAKKKKEAGLDLSLLEAASDTELVQLCRQMGFDSASRQVPRQELIDAILYSREEPFPDPLERVRNATYAYVQANRRSIRMSQMDCDLNCPLCPHNKTVDCYTDNHESVGG